MALPLWNSKTAHATQLCLHPNDGVSLGICGSGHSSNINNFGRFPGRAARRPLSPHLLHPHLRQPKEHCFAHFFGLLAKDSSLTQEKKAKKNDNWNFWFWFFIQNQKFQLSFCVFFVQLFANFLKITFLKKKKGAKIGFFKFLCFKFKI